MEKSGSKVVRKFRESRVSTAVMSTYSAASALAELLGRLSPKAIAARLGVSARTVKNWKSADNGPVWKHTVAMLNDDELCALLLEAAGRHDLAHQAKVMAAKDKLRKLEAG